MSKPSYIAPPAVVLWKVTVASFVTFTSYLLFFFDVLSNNVVYSLVSRVKIRIDGLCFIVFPLASLATL